MLGLAYILGTPSAKRKTEAAAEKLVLIIAIFTLTLALFTNEHNIAAPTIAMMTAIYLVKKLNKKPGTYIDQPLAEPMIYIGTFMATAIWFNGEMIKHYDPEQNEIVQKLLLIAGIWTEGFLAIVISNRVTQTIRVIRENRRNKFWAKAECRISLLITSAIFLGMTVNAAQAINPEDIAYQWWTEIWTTEWWMQLPIVMLVLATAIPIFKGKTETSPEKDDPDMKR